MRKATILAAAAALVGMGSIAHADGLVQKDTYRAPAAAQSVNWSGLYIGAGIGGGAVVHELDASIFEGYAGANLDGIGGEGIFGTVQVGLDQQFANRWVLGVFFDYDFSGIESEASAHFGPFSGKITLGQDYMWTAGGRIGYLLHPTTMAYALAGYSESEFVLDYPGGSWTMPTFSGFTVGGGLETQLAGNWFLKGEYRFTQFDKEELIGGEYFSLTNEPSLHTARVVLTHKLNLLGAPASPLK